MRDAAAPRPYRVPAGKRFCKFWTGVATRSRGAPFEKRGPRHPFATTGVNCMCRDVRWLRPRSNPYDLYNFVRRPR